MNLINHIETSFPDKVNVSRSHFIQRKFTINNPNDSHEKEADAFADRVTRMGNPAMAEADNSLFFAALPVAINRVQSKCPKEQKIRRQEMNGEEPRGSLENYIINLNNGGE